MQLIYPGFLWLSLLAIIPIALYLFRRKSKVVNVSTLVFFKTLAREHQESAWLRRLKKLLSLLLTLAILIGAILALSRVLLSPVSEENYQSVVILLDRSASMGAFDSEGKTRLEEARRLIENRLDSVPEDVDLALISYDARPVVLQPLTLKRRELLSRLAEVKVRPVAENTGVALDAAVVLAQLKTPSVIWHVTDTPSDAIEVVEPGAVETPETPLAEPVPEADADAAGETETSEEAVADEKARLVLALPEGVRRELINVARPEPINVGITAFQIRPVPLEHSRFDAYAQVALNADAPGPVIAKLEVNVGGMPAQIREVELNPGDREGMILKLEGAEEQMLRLSLKAEGDCLQDDNEVLIPLPRSRPVLAVWIRPETESDPFTELALSAIQGEGELELLKGTPDAWPLSDPVDVVIFDHWLPEEWPTDVPAIVMNPPGNSGPIRSRKLSAGIPHETIRAGNEQHPVLFRISTNRIALTQTSVFDISGSLEPLWMAGNEPVLAAGEVQGQRIVLMGFDPAQSEQLPLMASFPLLMGNALLWCAEASPTVTERLSELPTGRVVPVEGTEVTWIRPDGNGMQRVTLPLKAPLLELDRIGVWETDTGLRGASHLLSRTETNIRGQNVVDGAPSEIIESQDRLLAGDITWLILAIIAFILVAESYLFHRQAVY